MIALGNLEKLRCAWVLATAAKRLSLGTSSQAAWLRRTLLSGECCPCVLLTNLEGSAEAKLKEIKAMVAAVSVAIAAVVVAEVEPAAVTSGP